MLLSSSATPRRALAIHAGPRALAHLRTHGLRPEDVRAIPAAAGGAKGLTLLPLDRYLFAHWLPRADRPGAPPLHLLGASIGAWRMAAACLSDADAALAQLGEDYVMQTYPHAPGRMPTSAVVSAVFGQTLQQRLGARAAEVLAHPRRRLHVFTSRGRRLLHRPGRVTLPLGWMAAFGANALSRRALGGWTERVVFSDPRDPLPAALAEHGLRGRRVLLTPANLAPAVQASCSIPFVLDPVHDIPGAPPGSYWDGGITDYHLHLDYRLLARAAAMEGDAERAASGASTTGGAPAAPGVVLYPHFAPQLVPGWLDKSFRQRHRATPALDDLVLLSPEPAWVATLPGGKLPDRSDFKRFGDDEPARQRVWRTALAESQRLADEFAALVDDVSAGRPVPAQPLR
jgi:hypothetical protein